MRTARKLVVLMVEEFQPYGATWAELMHKSGLKPTAYKRAFNFAMEQNWFVGGGGQGKPYYLNPDGGWRSALGPIQGPLYSRVAGPDLQPKTWSSGPSSDVVQTLDPDSKIDRISALASESIRHANKG
jgi:hypothetical protein